jgi:cytidylate kinase
MRQKKKEKASTDIIAIDGPAGSGKSTVARLLARELKYSYIDTGAMYRALTLKAQRLKISLEDENALTKLAKDAEIDVIDDSKSGVKVILDGEDVSSLIRTPELTNKVSYIAKARGVRSRMKQTQRKIAERGKCVYEGRDIGTVVFPHAKYKFYLDADFNERSKRRYQEWTAKGHKVSYKVISDDLKLRDDKDMNRKIAPLKKADDAIYLDTTYLSIKQVVNRLKKYIKQ